MANETFLTNIFDYLGESRISLTEKFLIIVGTIIYVISPVDLLPGIIFDDIGVAGIVLAYMNWRIKKFSRKQILPQNEEADKKITEDFFKDR